MYGMDVDFAWVVFVVSGAVGLIMMAIETFWN